MGTWQMGARHYTQPIFFLGHLRPCPRRTLPQPPSATSNPRPFFHFRIYCSTNYPRWDSNAETGRSRNFNFRGKIEDEEEAPYGRKRRWWSDESPQIEEETRGFWEEAVDSIWTFKVVKSYGWTLPIIFMSLLFATGPKAFLMALALPLGQTAISIAFEKLWGRAETKPKRKYRMRRKPGRTVNSTAVEEEPEETQKTRKGKTGFQSWVVENNGSVDRGGREAPSFGGWDELERSGAATRSSSRVTDQSHRMPVEEGKLSTIERKSERPLLWRLLIAIFPILDTWTRIL